MRSYMATAQYDWYGTRGDAHRDPEIRNKSLNSVPDPPLQTNECNIPKLTSCWVPVPYLLHARSRRNKVFGTYSHGITCGEPATVSHCSRPSASNARSRLSGSESIIVHAGHVVLISSHIHIYNYLYIYIHVCRHIIFGRRNHAIFPFS